MPKPAASERAVYVGIGLVFALLVGGYFVYEIGGVVLAFLLSVLFSIIFGAPVNYLARRPGEEPAGPRHAVVRVARRPRQVPGRPRRAFRYR